MARDDRSRQLERATSAGLAARRGGGRGATGDTAKRLRHRRRLSRTRSAGNRPPGHNNAAMAGGDPTLSAVRTTEPDALTRLTRQACALAGADAAVLYVRDPDDPRA